MKLIVQFTVKYERVHASSLLISGVAFVVDVQITLIDYWIT